MQITKNYQGVYEARANGKVIRISKNSQCGWVLSGDTSPALGRKERAFGLLSEAKESVKRHLAVN